jgi:hypothetical protein
MSTPNILTIIGIAATIIFGIWGIIIVVRRRYPGEITYVKEAYIGLFDSIVKNLPELSVLYNNNPVGQGLVLVKGSILNTGSKDITESMIEQKISLSLPDEFRWLTAKIVGCSQNVHAEISIEGQNLSFLTGLFRCNEFIRFQAIAEVPIHPSKNERIERRLEKAIAINHRIADTKKVVSVDLPNKRCGKHRVLSLFSLALVMTILLIIGLSLGFRRPTAETHFITSDENSVSHEVVVEPKLDGKIILKGVKDNFRKVLNANEFVKFSNLTVRVTWSSDIKRATIMALCLSLFYWFCCFYEYREYRNQKKGDRLRKLLGIEDN